MYIILINLKLVPISEEITKLVELNISFSKYDYFGILIPGIFSLILVILLIPIDNFVNLGGLIAAFGNLEIAFIFLISVGIIIISYIIGLLLGGLGSWFLEDQIIGKKLGLPSQNLLQLEQSSKEYKFFKRYRMAYSEQFKKQFLKEFDEFFKGFGHENGDDIFRLCYHVVKEKCPNTFNRLSTFIALYGLYRSLTVTFLIGFGLFLINFILTLNAISLVFFISFPLLSLFCLYKFLQFYRAFSNEIFSSFYVYCLEQEKA